uniref:hypothetical protein n=1 Tax=Nocardia pseudovaccinii TaxID=189540 RepID=UPI000B1D5B59
PGWHDTTCDSHEKAVISCVSANTDFSLTLAYFDTPEAADRQIQQLSTHEQVRTEIHPDVSEPVKLIFTDPSAQFSVSYTGFSTDSDRNRFTVKIEQYETPSDDDQKLSLWKSMPLGM